jgi:hypothetical protein
MQQCGTRLELTYAESSTYMSDIPPSTSDRQVNPASPGFSQEYYVVGRGSWTMSQTLELGTLIGALRVLQIPQSPQYE